MATEVETFGAKTTNLREIFHQIKHDLGRWTKGLEFWRKREEAAHDEEKFAKQEKKSGLAMWDDPPEGWTERDLTKWSIGYTHGRLVECGNNIQSLEQAVWRLEDLINNDFGPRAGLPLPEHVKKHEERHLVGMWVCRVKLNAFPGSWPVLVSLKIVDGELRYSNGGKTHKPIDEDVLTSMPVDLSGCPAPWPE